MVSKFGNVWCIASNGKKFQSKAERDRYEYLLEQEKGGWIKDLKTQPSFDLMGPSGPLGTKYRADFTFWLHVNDQWVKVVEDVKGVETALFKLKWKLVMQLEPTTQFQISKRKGKDKWTITQTQTPIL